LATVVVLAAAQMTDLVLMLMVVVFLVLIAQLNMMCQSAAPQQHRQSLCMLPAQSLSHVGRKPYNSACNELRVPAAGQSMESPWHTWCQSARPL
jgi:hypothetical protein